MSQKRVFCQLFLLDSDCRGVDVKCHVAKHVRDSTNMAGFKRDWISFSVAISASQFSNDESEPAHFEEENGDGFKNVIAPKILMTVAILGRRQVNAKNTSKMFNTSIKRVLQLVYQCSPSTNYRRVWRSPRRLASSSRN